jgi:hypothetical protein
MAKKDNETVFSLRLPTEDAERLQREARSRGVTIARVAREALAAGLHPAAPASLSYGIPDPLPGTTLSISMIGVDLPRTTTSGGLAAESTPR